MRLWIVTFAVLLAVALPSVAQSNGTTFVESGYDLFATDSASFFFDGQGFRDFVGQPLGTYDFGSGDQGVGNTDTIVHRKDPADVDPDTIAIELVALSLVSVDFVNIGAGDEIVTATVDQDNGSTMIIRTSAKTFESTLRFDILFTGQTSGNTLVVGPKVFTASGDWDRTPDVAGAILIAGVNYRLNGSNTDKDFFTQGIILHDGGGGTVHNVKTSTPEPSSLIIWSLLAVGGISFTQWRRRRKN